MNSDTLRPLPNFLLVAIPQRFMAPKGPRSPDGLAITLLSGDDAMLELEQSIRAGGQVQIETETDTSISNMIRVGQVLQIPERLTDQQIVCMAGDKVRTFADITPVVEVGDEVYLDYTCLIDENEILPGIYRVPYSAIVCVISIEGGFNEQQFCWEAKRELKPVGGHVLLSRAWADDVTDYEVDGRMQKVRWNAAGTLISEYNVPPLRNQGYVAWVGEPLKGTIDQLKEGQEAILATDQALVETICGIEYLVIQQDYVLAVRQPTALQQNSFTKEFQLLPIGEPND